MIGDMTPVQERAFFYTPLSFLRSSNAALADHFLNALAEGESSGSVVGFGEAARLYVRHLPWDSEYFSCPTYRIEFADWHGDLHDERRALAEELSNLRAHLAKKHAKYYLFAEVPCEDLILLQSFGEVGMPLMETRLTYFRDDICDYAAPRRSSVRVASEADIPNLRDVAMSSRNRYDRFHADPFFSLAIADAFLGTFAENSVRGFADIVLVPNDLDRPPEAFLTAKMMHEYETLLGYKVGHMVLSAVGQTRRGWYLRLISEMSYWFASKGVRLAYMTTQSTNRAVIRVWESLGYRYGRCTHVFATHG